MFKNKNYDELLSKKNRRGGGFFSDTDVQIGLKKKTLKKPYEGKKHYGGKGP